MRQQGRNNITERILPEPNKHLNLPPVQPQPNFDTTLPIPPTVDLSLKAGDGLASDADGVLSVNVDNSTIEINADTLRVKDLGITTAKIADGAITNAKIPSLAGIDVSKLANGTVSNAEFETLNFVSSNIQTQINGKLDLTGGTLTGKLKVDGSVASDNQLIVEGAASQSGDLIRCQDSAATVVAKIASGGQLTCVDADTGFTDSNGHYQATSSRVNILLTELGWVLAENTRSWLTAHDIFSGYVWNQAPVFNSNSRMYGKNCLYDADTTIGAKNFRIPLWSTNIGGGVERAIDVYWTADTIPASDQIVRIRAEVDSGWNDGEAVPSATLSDTSVTITNTILVSKIYKTTINITTPTLGDGKLFTLITLRRRAYSDAADTYAGTFWVVGIDVRSGVLNS